MRSAAFTQALYERADRLLRADGDRCQRLRRAILEKSAEDDRLSWLELFLRQDYQTNEKPREAVESLIQVCKLPDSVLTEFRQRTRHAFLRHWQVIGPFSSASSHGREVAHPPELEPVQLGKEYDGTAGRVRWKLLESDTDRVDVHRLLKVDKPSVSYAVCWVHADAKLPALLEVGSRDSIKVWINPASQPKPVIDEPILQEVVPAQTSARIELQPDWNEIRIKLESRSGHSTFFVELRDTDGSLPLKGVRIQPEPPTQK